ncbi:sterol desaturase family protein [Sphingomonas sp. G124]|uniref:Sterol desaturase family protein n=1 Tax=Sphingomonas cremea TaxID=2904799 RepID=A0A9X1TZ21_9SPHN|nr:sterol desaturase family protein [Sphingomonas cremea]MCF2515407.1 sterol desaturase family protein [Sphingomonas cremea]
MIGTYHYIALALFSGFVLLELVSSGRLFPKISGWRVKGIAFTLLYFAVGTYAPLMWDGWLGEHRILAGDRLPLWVQAVGGFLLLELGVYCWHRTMHNVPPLWRWFHQMHHSAERVDIWGAFYFHPFDMLGWTLLGSLALVLGFGVSAEAAIVINLFATFCSMFQHANIRTPHWLGYLITRPESHSAHHERGVHARNYGDVPWFDMMFGTFHNPKKFNGEVGFYEGGSRKVGAMLIGRQIA